MRAARHEIVASPFGGRLSEQRRFNVDKAIVVEEIAHRIRDLRTEAQALSHLGSTQIDVAIAQADVFAYAGMLV